MRFFTQGYIAFMERKEFWENPYADIDGGPKGFDAWFAGWCKAKKDWA